jgi:hypothetical protein
MAAKAAEQIVSGAYLGDSLQRRIDIVVSASESDGEEQIGGEKHQLRSGVGTFWYSPCLRKKAKHFSPSSTRCKLTTNLARRNSWRVSSTSSSLSSASRRTGSPPW